MRFLLLMMIMTAVFSCRKAKVAVPITTIEEGVDVNVLYSAGDAWGEDDRYLPMPFNIAYRGLDTFMIIGNRIKSGKVSKVKPIGVARINNNLKNVDYIIAMPNDEKDQVVKVSSFMELSTTHSSVLWIIEQYLVNHRGERSNTTFVSWNDESQAEKLLIGHE